MNRRRLIAAAFFSVVILAVLGVIVGAEIVSGGQTVSVLRLRTDVLRGAVFSPADVDVVPLRIAPGDASHEAPGSIQAGARYALSLRTGDVLRPDDLEAPGAQVEITLDVKDPPPISPGQAVDLFAPMGQSQVLIAHQVPVVQITSGQITVLVSSQHELAWVEIAASGTQLNAVVSVTSGPSGLPPADPAEAICDLAPMQCAGLGGAPVIGSPAPTGAPLPSPGAAASP